MNIDLNTLCIVALSGVSLFFMGAFVRMVIRDKFNSIHDKIEQNVVDIYSEQEKLWRRLNELEKCCQTRCSPYPTNHIKNHYNTEA
jgi:hypothetical protein